MTLTSLLINLRDLNKTRLITNFRQNGGIETWIKSYSSVNKASYPTKLRSVGNKGRQARNITQKAHGVVFDVTTTSYQCHVPAGKQEACSTFS